MRGEIDALPDRVGPNAVMWNDCHELSFYFNPTDADAFHLNATERGVSGMMGGTGTGRRIPASLGTITTS